MKRRDLLKTGLATIGASTLALSGCSKIDNKSLTTDIIPKQTDVYKFSIPLPFDYKTIDDMVEFNSTVKKSQIKTLHNYILKPEVDIYNGYVHTVRGGDKSVKSLDDLGKYVKYAMNNGFHFVYLMNSTKSFTEEDFLTFKDHFLYLLDYLKRIGCRDIKVGCAQTIEILEEYAPKEFNWQVSTCYELHNIKQYENLFKSYPRFNSVDIVLDETQNFPLLRNLRKQFPDKKIEIMINEVCPKGCPRRITRACKSHCRFRFDKHNLAESFVKIASIFPWDIEYYSAIGINDFKFVKSHSHEQSYIVDLTALKTLINIIENGYENYTWKDLMDADWIPTYIVNDKNKDMKLSEIAPLLPDIRYFIKHGGMCASDCGVQCNYCFECAKELKRALKIG